MLFKLRYWYFRARKSVQFGPFSFDNPILKRRNYDLIFSFLARESARAEKSIERVAGYATLVP